MTQDICNSTKFKTVVEFWQKLPLPIILGAVYGEDGGDTPSSLDPDNLFRARRLAETVEAVGRSLK